MLNKILHYRVQAGLSRDTVASRLGVEANTLRQWERHDGGVPKRMLVELSKLLNTDSASLLGLHAPRCATVYDFDADPVDDYWGDVAIHFRGRGKPLLLSLSRRAAGELKGDMSEEGGWLVIKSMANQTVLVPKQAISELHMACEAASFFGPESESYESAPIQMPDPRDWEVVATLEDNIGADGGDAAEHFDRVRGQIMITSAQYEEHVAAGRISKEDLAEEQAKDKDDTRAIFELASTLVYQLTSGTQRRELAIGSARFVESVEPLLKGVEDQFNGFFSFSVDGEERDVWINASDLDYLSLPSQLLQRGLDELDDELLESCGDWED